MTDKMIPAMWILEDNSSVHCNKLGKLMIMWLEHNGRGVKTREKPFTLGIKNPQKNLKKGRSMIPLPFLKITLAQLLSVHKSEDYKLVDYCNQESSWWEWWWSRQGRYQWRWQK